MTPTEPKCEKCHSNLRGKEIPKEFLVKGYYGPWDGKTKEYYQRTIGVEIPALYDGIAFWRCPDCGHEWARKGMEFLFKEYQRLKETGDLNK